MTTLTQRITPDEVLRMPGRPDVTYILDRAPYTRYYWDGSKMVDTSSVSGAGKPLRVLWIGDSYGQRSNVGTAASAATVSGGIMTITAAGHGLGVGMPVSLAGANVPACMVQSTPVLTRADANTITVAAPGAPDGAVAVAAAARSGLTLVRQGQHSEEGTFVWLQRRSGYAFELVRNVSQPGYTVAEIVALWSQLVTPILPSVDLIVFEAGYNSLAQGESADTIITAYTAAIAGASGKPIYITCPWPVVSGSGADSAAKLQTALSVYWRLKALCEASTNAVFVDTFSGTVNASTGYAATGYIGADNIHKSARGSDLAAQAILARIAASSRPARALIASGLDTVATDATNPNIARNGLGLTTAGGSAGTFGTTVPGDETTATGGIMSAFAAAAVNGTTGNVFRKPAAAGNAQCLRAIGAAAGDQARLSLTLTTSDIVLGGRLDLTMRLKLRTDFNASNKTPAGQNVRGLLVQVVLVIDGNTYTVILSNVQGTPSAGIYVLSDIDTALSSSGIVVPTGAACTTARIDAIAHFDGAGTAQIELSEIALRKAS